MNKYLVRFLIFTVAILFSACGDESGKLYTEVEIKKGPVNKQAIIFPSLPSKNIETSSLDNI